MATYKITFNAELSESDLRAMNKYFYDTMNDMGIEDVWGLELEEIHEPTLEELIGKTWLHISDVTACFEVCKSKADVERVIELAPTHFGHFEVCFNDEDEYFTITNTFYERDEACEEEYDFDYPEDWEYDIDEDRSELPWDYGKHFD